ncbi:MAG: hypothetical protein ACT4PV_03565 [Planctomycetaceae bacterium]
MARHRPPPRRRRPAAAGPGPARVWILVGGGAALLVVLALWLTSGSKQGPSDSPAPPPAPPEDPLVAAERWYENSTHGAGAAQLRAALATATARGYDKLAGFGWPARARAIHERLRRLDPDDLDAARALGEFPVTDYPDFFAVFRRLMDAKQVPDEVARLRVTFESRISFRADPQGKRAVLLLPEVEFAALSRMLDLFREHEARLAADPTLEATLAALQRIRHDPILGPFETVHLNVRPFVLIYASRELGAKGEGAEVRRRVERKRTEALARLELHAGRIRELLAHFEERWRKPLELPEFGSTDLLYVWIFDDRVGFEEYGAKRETRLAPGLLGFFDPRVRWSFVYEDPADPGQVVWTLSHELIHHLQWHFSRDPKDPGRNHFEALRAAWFSEGWAEYVGAVEMQGNRVLFGRNSRTRMDMIHLCRRERLPLPPVRFLVKHGESYGEWVRQVARWLGQNRPELKDAARAVATLAYLDVLYAQSWLFVKFLYESGNGMYAEAAMRFTKAALTGFAGYRGSSGYPTAEDVLGQILGLGTAAAWARLQDEFDRFVEAKLYEVPPR